MITAKSNAIVGGPGEVSAGYWNTDLSHQTANRAGAYQRTQSNPYDQNLSLSI